MKNVMKRAWEIAKEGKLKFGGKVSEYLSVSLKMAWSEEKNTGERVLIATDFDKGVYHVYGERNGRIFRKSENLDDGEMKEAYGYLVSGKGINTLTRYIIKDGKEQKHTTMQVA